MIYPADAVGRDLRRLLRGDVEFDQVTRRLYATDAGLSQIEPLGVVSPRDAEDVRVLAGYAAEHGIPLVPRGMGSGLNGGAVGAGIQIDFTRYMNRVLEVAPDARWVRVQPGVVMGSLNRSLEKYGVFFPPDPSSQDHCSLGGMIGTNASGARTVAYGATKDHVLALDLVMADGSVFTARPMALESDEMTTLLAGGSLAERAFAALLPELHESQTMIRAGMPRVVKNSCGYRIEAVLDDGATMSGAAVCRTALGVGSGIGATPRPLGQAAEETTLQAAVAPRLAHLQKLFVGAEGTLGIVTEATLNLVPLPARRGIAMAYFPSVFAVGEAVPGILALSPTAVEIMDSRFLAVVRKNDSRVDAMLPEATDTALLIEFEGCDDEEVNEKFAVLRCHLDGTAALRVVRATTAEEVDHLWTVRKSAVALMQRMPGPKQPLPFVEDITVHPSGLPTLVDFLQKLYDREGVAAVMVGHVGDGNLHSRPVLDPKDSDDVRVMQRLYDEISGYVLSVRGTMSGEHGDGLVHTSRIEEMYGPEIYGLFTRIKQAFDPQQVLNPGKKVGPQGAMPRLFKDVRYGPSYGTVPQKPILHFGPRGYESEIERCHGCAVCKSAAGTTMCPTYKATRREQAAPRAKANLLRAIITGALDPETSYGRAAVKNVTDYCIECGMCAVECPSRVNIPKLMLEAKSRYREAHRGSPTELVLGRAELVSRVGHLAAPLANRIINRPFLRRLAEPLTGIDRHRPMAPFAARTLAQVATAGTGRAASREARFAPAAPPAASAQHHAATVAYFYDLYANYSDPGLGLTVKRILEAHGIEVVVPEQRASGIPEMLYGYAERAKETAECNVSAVLRLVKQGAALVTAEPTASFAFKVHYPDYVRSAACSLVANATHDLGEFLVRHRTDHPESAPAPGPLRALSTVRAGDPAALRIGYHQPCHLKAQQVGNPGLELLREIPGIEVVDLAAGCCGMAGTFGMKAHTYDLSMAVGRPLFDRVAEVAPDLLCSECSTCRMQLEHATGIEAVHPAVLLADSYGL